MAEDRPLHDLIVELRASEPDWQSSIARFRQYRRLQAIRYAQSNRGPAQTGQQRECLCGQPVHVSGNGVKSELDGTRHDCYYDKPTPVVTAPPPPVHPETAEMLERGFAGSGPARVRPKTTTPQTEPVSGVPDALKDIMRAYRK